MKSDREISEPPQSEIGAEYCRPLADPVLVLVLGYFVRDFARAFELDRRRREFVVCRPHLGQILGYGLSNVAQIIDKARWKKVRADGNIFFLSP